MASVGKERTIIKEDGKKNNSGKSGAKKVPVIWQSGKKGSFPIGDVSAMILDSSLASKTIEPSVAKGLKGFVASNKETDREIAARERSNTVSTVVPSEIDGWSQRSHAWQVGDELEVLRDFKAVNEGERVDVRAGMVGVVKKVDAQGDVLVVFQGLRQPQWVLKDHFKYLKIQDHRDFLDDDDLRFGNAGIVKSNLVDKVASKAEAKAEGRSWFMSKKDSMVGRNSDYDDGPIVVKLASRASQRGKRGSDDGPFVGKLASSALQMGKNESNDPLARGVDEPKKKKGFIGNAMGFFGGRKRSMAKSETGSSSMSFFTRSAPPAPVAKETLPVQIYKVDGGNQANSRKLPGMYKSTGNLHEKRQAYMRTDGAFFMFWGGSRNKGWWISTALGTVGQTTMGVNALNPLDIKEPPIDGWSCVCNIKGVSRDTTLKVTFFKLVGPPPEAKKEKKSMKLLVRFRSASTVDRGGKNMDDKESYTSVHASFGGIRGMLKVLTPTKFVSKSKVLEALTEEEDDHDHHHHQHRVGHRSSGDQHHEHHHHNVGHRSSDERHRHHNNPMGTVSSTDSSIGDERAARIIQSQYRNHRENELRKTSATIIQKQWRSKKAKDAYGDIPSEEYDDCSSKTSSNCVGSRGSDESRIKQKKDKKERRQDSSRKRGSEEADDYSLQRADSDSAGAETPKSSKTKELKKVKPKGGYAASRGSAVPSQKNEGRRETRESSDDVYRSTSPKVGSGRKVKGSFEGGDEARTTSTARKKTKEDFDDGPSVAKSQTDRSGAPKRDPARLMADLRASYVATTTKADSKSRLAPTASAAKINSGSKSAPKKK